MTVTPASSVKSLLLLMTCSVACALAIAYFSVQQFGPSGNYEVKNALITPYLLENMDYNAPETGTGAEVRYVFDELIYSFYEASSHKWISQTLSMQDYRNFYDIISSDISTPGYSFETLFNGANASKLTVKVRPAEGNTGSEVFQEVEFAPEGNFYRIELREELNPQGKWAYYNHPGITKKINTLFVAP